MFYHSFIIGHYLYKERNLIKIRWLIYFKGCLTLNFTRILFSPPNLVKKNLHPKSKHTNYRCELNFNILSRPMNFKFSPMMELGEFSIIFEELVRIDGIIVELT